jgi:3-deoxy-D-manno-octulosonic-acid transferase
MAPPSLWIYRILMAVSLPVAAPFLLLADRRRGKKRPPLAQRLGLRLPTIPVGGVWVQAVSVGEVAVARPLLAELRRRHPSLPLVLSATTATGLAMASGVQLADVTLPFPVDLPGPVRRLMDAARPRLVVLVETELWPELLSACGSRGIPVALVNARVSDKSFRGYQAVRALLRPLLAPISVARAQDEQSARRLVAMGVPPERVQMTGNVKFDARSPGTPPRVIDELRQVAGGRPVLVAGSTMPGEDEELLDCVLRLAPQERPFLLLAPRHPERAPQVMQLAADRGFSVTRRTLLPEAAPGCGVVVLDTVGELAGLYQIADVAFIGGSLVPTGGHNPIEPARFGVPVLTGPHVRNFAVVYRSFVDAGAARIVHSEAELTQALTVWFADRPAARAAGEAGRQLLASNTGATARIAVALEKFLA